MADALSDIVGDPDERQTHIVEVLGDAFSDLIEADPRAFRRKFRKMAADPFSFYRGSACLFYNDVARLEDPWAEGVRAASGSGRPHARTTCTYMDSEGVLVFDVKRLRRGLPRPLHLGPAEDGGQLALLATQALSDETIEQMIAPTAPLTSSRCAPSRPRTARHEFRLTLETTEGPLTPGAAPARLKTRLDRWTPAYVGLARAPFSEAPGCAAGFDRRDEVLKAYEGYLETIRRTSASRASPMR